METARLEWELIRIARKFAPTLVPPGWRKPGDYALLAPAYVVGGLFDLPAESPRDPSLGGLARALADFNVLVLVGHVSPSLAHQASLYLKEWVDTYQRLYTVLTAPLFRSFTQVGAFYVDQELPRVVVIQGAATPVIVQMAALLVPYITSRQQLQFASTVEMHGLMDFVIDQLEAYDLHPDDKRRIKHDAVQLMSQLINGYVRHEPLVPVPDMLQGSTGVGGFVAPDFLETEMLPSSQQASKPVRPPVDMLMPPATLPRIEYDAGDQRQIIQPEKTARVFTDFESYDSGDSESIPPFYPPFTLPPTLPEIELLTETGSSRSIPAQPADPPEMPPAAPNHLPRTNAPDGTEDETQADRPFERTRFPMFSRNRNKDNSRDNRDNKDDKRPPFSPVARK